MQIVENHKNPKVIIHKLKYKRVILFQIYTFSKKNATLSLSITLLS